MCTYQAAGFLHEQLESLRDQERPPDELVVCDDASGDGTGDAVERFANRAGFPVRLHVNPDRLGYVQNFDEAISRCIGDVIALCDQDDVWRPHKLRRMERVFVRSPTVVAAFSDADVIDEWSRPLGYRLWQSHQFSRPARRRAARDGFMEVLLRANVVTGATLAFRREIGALAVPTPSGFHHDEWIALCAASVGTVAIHPEPLVGYRSHPGQTIGAPAWNGYRDSVAALVRVGVRPDPTGILARAAYYAGQGNALVDRLAERGYEQQAGVARTKLEERLHHLQGRAALWTNGRARLSFVVQELVTGRYHRYSRGLLSALKDAAIRTAAPLVPG
jgi:glycosyltransferase involved in cell wall biosynthesis